MAIGIAARDRTTRRRRTAAAAGAARPGSSTAEAASAWTAGWTQDEHRALAVLVGHGLVTEDEIQRGARQWDRA